MRSVVDNHISDPHRCVHCQLHGLQTCAAALAHVQQRTPTASLTSEHVPAAATDAEGGHSHAAIRGAGPGTAAAPPTTDFTATLRQMAQAGADAAAQGASPPDGGGDGGMEGMLAGMLAQMQAAVEGQGDPGSVAEMDDFTAAIMRNLLSKEILYPSMSVRVQSACLVGASCLLCRLGCPLCSSSRCGCVPMRWCCLGAVCPLFWSGVQPRGGWRKV